MDREDLKGALVGVVIGCALAAWLFVHWSA